MSNKRLDSRRRRRVLAGIGIATVGSGFASTAVAGQEETVTVTLDNVGVSAWEVTGVEGADDVGPTGEENPTLTLREGVRYTFVNNGGSSHPLAFRASDGETLLSQSGDGSFEGDSETDWVDDGGSVSFTLTSELADEMATYVCTVHGSMTGAIETTQTGPAATVTFSDQSSTGTSVVVDAVELADGGFVTIHNSNLLDGDAVGSVIGVSEYLDSGSYENLTVELDTPLVEGDTLVAMPHRDTNGNQTYDFVESEGGADGPYVVEGDAVIDDADVQVDGAAAVQMSDQMTQGETVIVDFARLDDGGFVTIHDSTLLDGDPLGSVVGVSGPLESGTYDNRSISLEETLTEDETLIAMPHRDTDGDGEYTFVESEGDADGPYTFDGGAVTDAADVTVLGDATVTFSDQETDGTSVVVDSADLDDGGFVTIHDSSLLDGDPLESVVGVSEYLAPGSYDDIEISLDEELTEDDTLIAMPHRDTNGNQAYDFVEEEGGADGPYFTDEAAVTARAEVTVLGDATVSFSDQETDGMAVVVDSANLDDGGFVTIHDSSLLDGDALGSVVGVSEYLEPGSYDDLEVVLDEALTEDDTLIAMPHRDTNGNQTYDFVESEGGADGPYVDDQGSAVVADASVTVTGDMDGGMDETDDGMGETDTDGEMDETESADGDGPGFGPVAGIAGLSGVATYLYRTFSVDDGTEED